ncbi:MAG: S1 family peptidase [Caulobacteraceae bacterium]
MVRVIIAAIIAAAAIFKVADAATLAQRYTRLSCAIVYLHTDKEGGTGFFIDAAGHVATAAHVALDRSISGSPQKYTATLKDGLMLHLPSGNDYPMPPQILTEKQVALSHRDIVILSTGIPSSCFIPVLSHARLPIGEHVIAIGYPATAHSGLAPEITLFDGFISSRYSGTHAVANIIDRPGYSTTENFDVLRLQMPVTPGASGSPVIDDNGSAVAIVIETPVPELGDINALIQGEIFRKPAGTALIMGMNLNKILAEYIFLSQTYVSSGSGLAVPLSYLSKR